MTKERRKVQRIKETLTVMRCSMKYLFESNSLSRDISSGGICLFSPKKIEIGEAIKLAIYVPESKQPIIASGEVVRRNETNDLKYPFLLGIKFTEIKSEARNNILSHIRFYLQKSDKATS